MVLTQSVMAIIRTESFRAWRSLRDYGFDVSDVSQEITLHWVRRRHHYDPSRSLATTFAAHICRHRSLQLIETAMAGKRRAIVVSLSDRISLGDEDDVERGETISHETYAMNSGRQARPDDELFLLRLAVQQVMAKLPPDLDAMAQLLATGEPVMGVARSMAISPSTAYRLVARLRSAFREAGLDQHNSHKREKEGTL